MLRLSTFQGAKSVQLRAKKKESPQNEDFVKLNLKIIFSD